MNCVPVGMEFFPSTGLAQWPVILDSLTSSDFCVFVLAGRYGTISDDDELSWTHREFREAVRSNKPIVALIHERPESLPADKSETSSDAKNRLMKFHDEVKRQQLCKYFKTEADLVRAVSSSVHALQQDGLIDGWVPAGKNPIVLQGSDFEWRYELMDVSWSFSKSRIEGLWDGAYVNRRKLVATDEAGVEASAISFSRDTDNLLPFEDNHFPKFSVSKFSRTDMGSYELRTPRRWRGGAFVQDLVFRPPLEKGATADFLLEGRFTGYKHAYRDDLFVATKESRSGPREFDWASRRLGYPTERFRMTVFLPLDLEATPRGPMVFRNGRTLDNDLTSVIKERGGYNVKKTTRDGVEGYEMSLDVTDPQIRRNYRLAWDLPGKKRS